MPPTCGDAWGSPTRAAMMAVGVVEAVVMALRCALAAAGPVMIGVGVLHHLVPAVPALGFAATYGLLVAGRLALAAVNGNLRIGQPASDARQRRTARHDGIHLPKRGRPAVGPHRCALAGRADRPPRRPRRRRTRHCPGMGAAGGSAGGAGGGPGRSGEDTVGDRLPRGCCGRRRYRRSSAPASLTAPTTQPRAQPRPAHRPAARSGLERLHLLDVQTGPFCANGARLRTPLQRLL